MSAWAIPPGAFNKKIIEDHRKEVTRIAIKILQRVTQATPKDTGYAAANWVISLGVPTTLKPGGTDWRSNLTANITKASKAKPFPIIYLNNAVEYIGVLNYGRPTGNRHSMKAPLHFVELAISEAQKVKA